MSAIKKTYRVVASLALLHMVGLVGVIGYLAGSGRITEEQARQIAEILRQDEDGEQDAADDQPSDDSKTDSVVDGDSSGADREEIARRNIERLMAEADHQLVLAKRTMVDLTRRREEFEREQAESAQRQERAAVEGQRQGFKKDVELLSSLTPKVALDHLLLRPVEDAARLYMAMDSRKGRKIEETAHKDPRKWAKMVPILMKIRELSPAGADEATDR